MWRARSLNAQGSSSRQGCCVRVHLNSHAARPPHTLLPFRGCDRLRRRPRGACLGRIGAVARRERRERAGCSFPTDAGVRPVRSVALACDDLREHPARKCGRPLLRAEAGVCARPVARSADRPTRRLAAGIQDARSPRECGSPAGPSTRRSATSRPPATRTGSHRRRCQSRRFAARTHPAIRKLSH
jgi:hypothetical protein